MVDYRYSGCRELRHLQAQAAYEAVGAAILDEKIYYRLDAKAIACLAEEA